VTIKKTCALGSLGLLFACVSAMIVGAAISVWPKTRTPPVDTLDLMLDLSVFPNEWDLCLGPAPLPKREQGERESLHVGFCPEDFEGIGGSLHRVYRYRNEVDAAILFHLEFSGGGFPKWHMTSPWIVPEELAYESSVADRFKFACGEVDALGRRGICQAVAQYDEYISVFIVHLSPDNMTLQDVERILVAIDEQMALHLGKEVE
jgi:hypothetical protein